MANAIHLAGATDTLNSVAKEYYYLEHADTTDDDVGLKRVVEAIREATPDTVSTLPAEDDTTFGAGTTLFIPTLRDMNRQLLVSDSNLEDDLRAAGFEHARKLLAYTPAEVFAHADLSSYMLADIEKAHGLTALFNLDGMDAYTALHLYEDQGIETLSDLTGQTAAAIDFILAALVSGESRPTELDEQGHGTRWTVEAKIITRNRIGKVTIANKRQLQIPVAPSEATKLAEFYESAVTDDSYTAPEADLAEQLGYLYRFQEGLLKGNQANLAGRHNEAITYYQEARRAYHRLAETNGAVTAVDDTAGMNFNDCAETMKRVLDAMPAEDDCPLGAPTQQLRRRSTQRKFRLRGFRYDELDTTYQLDVQNEADFNGDYLHNMPRVVRSEAQRRVLPKLREELSEADTAMVSGLVSAGSGKVLTRDLEDQDREVLRRNVGQTTMLNLMDGQDKLDIFGLVGAKLALSDVSTQLSALTDPGGDWDGVSMSTLLATSADYPNDPGEFLTQASIFDKFVVVPGTSPEQYLIVDSNFVANYRDTYVKDRLMSTSADALVLDDDAWGTPGGFAGIAPLLYCSQLCTGMGKAYAKLGKVDQANFYGMQRTNVYKSDGTELNDIAGADFSANVMSSSVLQTCATDWGTAAAGGAHLQSILNYASYQIDSADWAYRQDDRETARALYADVRCAIESSFSDVADQARIGISAIADYLANPPANTAKKGPFELSIFDVTYEEGGSPKRVMEDVVTVVKSTSYGRGTSLDVRKQVAQQRFSWVSNAVPAVTNVSVDAAITDIQLDSVEAGRFVQIGDTLVYISPTDDGTLELFNLYVKCESKISQIDAGANWWGFTDDYLPPWTFDKLYDEARNLCDRALAAENAVYSLLSDLTNRKILEYEAGQALELSYEKVTVAEANLVAQMYAKWVAVLQAEYTELQAAEKEDVSAIESKRQQTKADVQKVTSLGIAFLFNKGITGDASENASSMEADIEHAAAQEQLAIAESIADATAELAAASQAAATAAYNLAQTEQTLAQEYIDFLDSQQLNSAGLEVLLGLTREVHEVYMEQANRMALLAQRALEHQTKREFNRVKFSYYTSNEYENLTRAQRMTADLETLRSEYVAGQTERLQEVKWTVALSQLDPTAWQSLRETGQGTFFLHQRRVDQAFPGAYLHRIKEITLSFIGLLPAQGVRGILHNSGISRVRVPNQSNYITGITPDPDWPKAITNYDQYVMKTVVTQPSTIVLSEFDVSEGGHVLSTPQGMLGGAELDGLDSAWTIKLHRIANSMDFENIVDVEITFWFLCAYDPGLDSAQQSAWVQDGLNGDLSTSVPRSFAVAAGSDWSDFVGDPTDPERLDLRVLPWVVADANLPQWETNRKLQNIMLGIARASSQSGELTFRLITALDPAGSEGAFTTSDGAIFSAHGLTLDHDPPVSDPVPTQALEDWIDNNFYSGGSPDGSPLGRWVIKVQPSQAGTAWHKEDEDGVAETTTSGPLEGTADGSTPGTATYDDGTAWTDMKLAVKVLTDGSTVRLRVRDDGTDHYALEIAPSTVKLFRVGSGGDTQVGSTLSLTYPTDEFLYVEFSVVDQKLSVSIDTIELFSDEAGGSSHTTGSVALEVSANGTGPAQFDDVEVVRMTKKSAAAETLLAEPFTSSLPSDWTFVDGSTAWGISSTPHKLLDLSTLLNLTLSIDYTYEIAT